MILKNVLQSYVLFFKKKSPYFEAEEQIRGRVQTQVERNQREYYLGEQMKAIQKELGREDQSAEWNNYEQKLNHLIFQRSA